MEYERNSSVPAGNLGFDLYLPELDVVAFACRQPSTLDRVDDNAGGRIADDTTGLPVNICAPGEVICIAVENSVSTNDIRGQGGENV